MEKATWQRELPGQRRGAAKAAALLRAAPGAAGAEPPLLRDHPIPPQPFPSYPILSLPHGDAASPATVLS